MSKSKELAPGAEVTCRGVKGKITATLEGGKVSFESSDGKQAFSCSADECVTAPAARPPGPTKEALAKREAYAKAKAKKKAH